MKKYDSFDQYLIDQSPIGKEMLLELKEIILSVVPDAEEQMGYGVPAYGMRSNAKLDDKIMIAGMKAHVGFYPHKTTIKAFKEELKPYKTLESTVQFKHTEKIPVELVRKMVLYRYKKVNNI